MTQSELEQVARQLRDRGLHSSWNELMKLSDCVVVNLVDAYQTLLKIPVASDITTSSITRDVHMMLQEKLAKALTSLTSESQVAGWKSEVFAGSGYFSNNEITQG